MSKIHLFVESNLHGWSDGTLMKNANEHIERWMEREIKGWRDDWMDPLKVLDDDNKLSKRSYSDQKNIKSNTIVFP